ncbi:hypothetical protein Y032_0015g2686 [Ancylostoma ceylanicum]|uniref:Uncharacterized protein n=1 Tax=Ancylostoma ceylanicum TaxID=53326 RepID=A0A016V8B7_9BILA|nr:hypothetical protein Y032_0015g2686 [Ancylostoma ceylanicum]
MVNNQSAVQCRREEIKEKDGFATGQAMEEGYAGVQLWLDAWRRVRCYDKGAPALKMGGDGFTVVIRVCRRLKVGKRRRTG